MKKTFVLFAAFVACIALSCNKISEEVVDPETGMKTITITATIDESTKTSYADGTGVFSWTAGDEISVLCTDGNFYTFSATSTGSSSTFTGSIPGGESIGDRAYFPADAGHTADSFNLPYYKDITGHDSADIPMFGTKVGSTSSFSFSHCAGAALLTIRNIPDGITSVTITVASTHSTDPAYNYKLSGLFYIHTAYPKWDGAYATAANENIYSRKVSVSSHTAKLFVPAPAGANNWVPNKLTVTGHSGGGDVVLLSDKSMAALGIIERAHVTPLSPLGVCQLGFIDWSDAGVQVFEAGGAGSNTGDRIQQWKATMDADYLYFYYKILKEKIKWVDDPGTYVGSQSTIYIGLDLDNNTTTGSSDSYAGMTAEGWEATVEVRPWSGTTKGSPEVIPGENASSYIDRPVGTTLGAKVSQYCTFDATYAYLEIAIPRSALGATSSSIRVRHEMQWGYYTSFKTMTMN